MYIWIVLMWFSLSLLQVCIDVIVQRLGDAAAAGIYKLLSNSLNKRASIVSICALPVCTPISILSTFILWKRLILYACTNQGIYLFQSAQVYFSLSQFSEWKTLITQLVDFGDLGLCH